MCTFYFLVWTFIQAILIKTTLKQGQKEEERSKAKKIIVEGNLNSICVLCFKEHFNFVVFEISLQGWFMPLISPSV